MFSPLGKIKEALADIKVALDLRPSAQLFVMSGTLLFMQEVRKKLPYEVLCDYQCIFFNQSVLMKEGKIKTVTLKKRNNYYINNPCLSFDSFFQDK